MKKIPTFLFVHGACHGGWCWKELVPLLQPQINKIYTPTLTGCGERIHLLTRDITLQTHIDDIVNVIRYEDLNNVILIGHSYAGLIIPAVYEAVSDRINQLVFLDSYIPASGKTGFDILEPQYQEQWQYVAQTQGQGWLMPANENSLDVWGVSNQAIRDFLLPKITDFSINFLKTPIFLTELFEQANKTYIRCTRPNYVNELMSPFYLQAQRNQWPIYEIDSDHEPQLTAPKQLAEILLKIV